MRRRWNEDLSNLPDPDADQLKKWFAANPGRFSEPARVSFEHLYFSPDLRGKRAEQDASTAFAELKDDPQTPVDADAFVFERYYADRSADQIASVFGTSFAKSVTGMPTGAWQGPVRSGLGFHLVRVASSTPGRVPPFPEIEVQVRSEWVADQRQAAKQKTFAALRARYEIAVPAGLPIPGKVATSQPSAVGDLR